MSENSVFQPTSQHKWLSRNVGTWEVECSYYMIPGEDPLEVTGQEVVETLGPFWVVGRFEADMMGSPVTGQAVTGYDPIKGLFIGTWKDNSTPFHYTFEGTLSDDERILALEGSNFDPVRQRESIYRCRTEYLSDSEHVMTLTVEVNGEEVPILKYHYKRQ